MNRDLQRQVRDALTKLGTTPVDVAATLANKGIVGISRNTMSCPIAQYLRTQFPEIRVAVGARVTTFLPERPTFLSSPHPRVANPEPVARFVTLFDDGAFPDLEIEPADQYL